MQAVLQCAQSVPFPTTAQYPVVPYPHEAVWQEDSMPLQITINQIVKNPFEEPLTFLLTYSLLGDWYKGKDLNQQKEAIGYKFY